MLIQNEHGEINYHVFKDEIHKELEVIHKELKEANEFIFKKYNDRLLKLYDEDFIGYESLRQEAEDELQGIIEKINVRLQKILKGEKAERIIPVSEIYFSETVH